MKVKAAKRKRAKPVARTTTSKMPTAQQIVLLRQTFSAIEAQSDIAALVFYRNLFALDPSLRALFHTSIELQGRKLMEALEFTTATLEDPKKLVPVLEAMGRRHVTYGTKQAHYDTVTRAMLQTLAETLGEKFTAPVAEAWKLALGFVCEAMQRGASDVEQLMADERPTSSKVNKPATLQR
jgi:hemoglobin-like flavoprotein